MNLPDTGSIPVSSTSFQKTKRGGNTMGLKVNESFRELIPPLTAEEYSQLEENILAEGCRDALVVWGNVIVDGHNRHEICTMHGVEFETKQKEFESEEAAKVWIIDNQSGRRNLTDGWKYELKQERKRLLAGKGWENIKAATGGHNKLTLSQNDKVNTREELASELGWATGKVAQADFVWKHGDEEIKQKVKAGEETVSGAYNKVKRDVKKKTVEQKVIEYRSTTENESVDIFTTDRKYNIVYADPPWQYWDGGQKNQSLHYNTMTIEEICKLPIDKITDENAILFLWVTYPMLQQAFDVMSVWGFKYSTAGFVWVKRNKKSDTPFFGCGSWTRANSELCLIGTKGSVLRLDASVSQVIESVIDEHSKKPAETRDRIIRLVGDLPKIELFSRQDVEGWDRWGEAI